MTQTHLRINDLRAVGFWSTKPNPFVVLSRLKDDVDLGNRKHNAHVEDSADWKHLAHSKVCDRASRRARGLGLTLFGYSVADLIRPVSNNRFCVRVFGVCDDGW